MTPLGREIAAMIAEDGPMSVERFMTLAAMHPQHGYYRTRVPIGAQGDFITAPEIHQMFGELIGLWAAEVWRAMGEPAAVRLVELGPGRGTLMADLLRAARVAPGFRAALDVHLVEMSEPLAAEQHRDAGEPPVYRSPGTKRSSRCRSGPTMIIANEFFDALPVRQYVRAPAGWCERVVGLDADGALCFGLAPAPQGGLTAPAAPEATLAVGTIVESASSAQRLMSRLAGHIARGARRAARHRLRPCEDTAGRDLAGHEGHMRPTDPLREPGEADLTAHVDFAALARAAYGRRRLRSWSGYARHVSRAASACSSVPQLLKRKANAAQSAAIDAALGRLAVPGPRRGPTRAWRNISRFSP